MRPSAAVRVAVVSIVFALALDRLNQQGRAEPTPTVSEVVERGLQAPAESDDQRVQRLLESLRERGCPEDTRLREVVRTLVLFRHGRALFRFTSQPDALVAALGVSREEARRLAELVAKDKCTSDERLERTAKTLISFLCHPSADIAAMSAYVRASDMQCCCVKAMVGSSSFSAFLTGLGIPADHETHHGCLRKNVGRCP